MFCDNKDCLKEIPDDSLFCDQCGHEILSCPECCYLTTISRCSICMHQKKKNIITLSRKDNISNQTIVNQKDDIVKFLYCETLNFKITIKDNLLIGRNYQKELSNDPKISREHALITKELNEIIYQDKSSNGSFINGKKIHNQKIKISNKDKLTIGSLTFIFQ